MVQLTVSQAVVTFLARQYVERDGVRTQFFAGCFGIFGHGNVAGLGQALLQAEVSDLEAGRPASLPYVLARNEQAMVHSAVAYARHKDRLQAWAVTASIGPGSANMLTGAALATINRLPVLLLPSDTFATRVADPVLQQLEQPYGGDLTVNDSFRPLSRFFDRVTRPEQLPAALLGAMRVLTDPVETGCATIAIPQDVQAEAFDWPEELFAERTWYVARPVPETAALDRAVALIKSARRPVIVSGGGTIYSQANAELQAFAEATGIPVGETQAGKGSLAFDHAQSLGAIGSTGTTAANACAREADLIIGIGTRYSDFTTASRTQFQNPDVKFLNINVAGQDAVKHSGLSLIADAREALVALQGRLAGYTIDGDYAEFIAAEKQRWEATVDSVCHPQQPNRGRGGSLTQNEVIGIVNSVTDPRDVVVCAAGSMPGDLHKLWRARDRKNYHVEYGFSCMGYEIAGGLGIKMAAISDAHAGAYDRDVVVMVGDGSYLMMATELATAVQEGIKIITVLVQNHGFASIGALSESLGSQRFGTQYRKRDDAGRLEGEHLPTDLAANAASFGVRVIKTQTAAEFEAAMREAKAATESVVVYVETDLFDDAPTSESWWDVPVSQVSTLESTQRAYTTYTSWKDKQKAYLTPTVAPTA
ncbi:3D-(3,5/4)-trihydroxycyclohexane-1,2-dione acylhydrolase (decyclizing) [Micrococcales bacterium 31B]|nr:3D-(3,5/4)-trihydroxycyclohexane-1,2-dione acylhydrolase (decyclizing) [Micrococcales bacterium 31B]